jgi:hypothetical protein
MSASCSQVPFLVDGNEVLDLVTLNLERRRPDHSAFEQKPVRRPTTSSPQNAWLPGPASSSPG